MTAIVCSPSSACHINIMSLTAMYERFLASPNPISLSENASLHYIPTLTTHSQSGPIIRHLESQNKNVVTIKSAKTISVIEGQNAIAIEIDTTMEFVSGGGAYLPGLENFVADKIATLPIVSTQCERKTLSLTFADSCRYLRTRPEDHPNPYILGSRLFAQTDRCHWLSRTQLACR